MIMELKLVIKENSKVIVGCNCVNWNSIKIIDAMHDIDGELGQNGDAYIWRCSIARAVTICKSDLSHSVM